MDTITQTTPAKPVLAILCPCYNEQETVGLFFERLRPVIDSLSDRYTVKTFFKQLLE
jgi:hypothetical protein